MNYKEVLQDAIKVYGPELQQIIAIEEMSELQKEICKNKRGRDNIGQIAEEIADVLICIDQLKIMFDIEELVEEWKNAKVMRLNNRIAKTLYDRQTRRAENEKRV